MMKFMWSIAAKNLMRNKLRSSISIAAIAISVCMVVIVRGLLTGMLDNMVDLNIQYNSGHIKIVDTEYKKKERLLSLNYPVDGFEGEGTTAMANRLAQVQGIEKVVQRLKFGVAASDGDKMVGMLGWGVKPEDELQYTDIKKMLTEGRMVESGKQEVVLGAGILEKLKLEVGQKITVFYSTAFGSFKGSTFAIVGKVQSGLKLLDDSVLYIPIDQAQRILDMPDQSTELLLFTKNYRHIKSQMAALTDLFKAEDEAGRYKIIAWPKSSSMIEMMQIGEKIYNIVYVLLILLSCIVIINTMIMIVKERTAEIGMMTALGLRSSDVLKLFIMEGSVMGIIGSFLGAILGGISTIILAQVGLDYTEAMKGIGSDILINTVIYPVFSVRNMIFCFVLGAIVTALTCILPARRAANLEPTEALRAI